MLQRSVMTSSFVTSLRHSACYLTGRQTSWLNIHAHPHPLCPPGKYVQVELQDLIISVFLEPLICFQLSNVKRKEIAFTKRTFSICGENSFDCYCGLLFRISWLTQTCKMHVNFLSRTQTFLRAQSCSLSLRVYLQVQAWRWGEKRICADSFMIQVLQRLKLQKKIKYVAWLLTNVLCKYSSKCLICNIMDALTIVFFYYIDLGLLIKGLLWNSSPPWYNN